MKKVNKVEIHCKKCHKSKFIIPSQVKETGNFCSRECRNIWNGINQRGKKHHYCNDKRRENIKKVEIFCKKCGKNKFIHPCRVNPNGNFCSISCAMSFNNKGEKNYQWNERLDINCKFCGKKNNIKRCRVNPNGNFCNIACASKYFSETRRGENAPNWLGGKSFEPYGVEFSDKLRSYIRERDNHTCQECHMTEKQLGYRMPVHHIDYNKKNNVAENLISLCKSCHAQTNFKREDWVNYFKNRSVIGE